MLSLDLAACKRCMHWEQQQRKKEKHESITNTDGRFQSTRTIPPEQTRAWIRRLLSPKTTACPTFLDRSQYAHIRIYFSLIIGNNRRIFRTPSKKGLIQWQRPHPGFTALSSPCEKIRKIGTVIDSGRWWMKLSRRGLYAVNNQKIERRWWWR